ncbi:NADH:flavin oxidoreductase / NADH oxidase family/EF hand, putative [Angomonas deanei]|uniref:NADH:flavin oxidoreductase / NADH oxidase family/EF hand, putative n=1 Tax=Angomonas deanei TaxID=59799 RepID=A0A7G2CIK8_9TRYP|nr:NADH:flavin oxidoreductase / NADH oxidase family/EF hand, putative [Angomonas deanei]
MSTVESLLKPLQVGRYTLPNRFIMAPLTRTRATEDHVATDAMVKYYTDRASFGLIIAEACQIREGYSTFAYEPGVYGKAQVEGWKKVTQSVHEKGGLIFLQIHHGGRATVQCNLDDGIKVCGPSEQGIVNHSCPGAFAKDGEKQPYPAKVHALTEKEIEYHVKLFTVAAKNAMAAGFDGVQIHGANSYLIDSFLRDGANKRTDAYGGSVENRCRFLLEIVDSVVAAIGADRVSVRLSPLNAYNDTTDSDPEGLTRYVCGELSKRKLAFLDVMRGDMFNPAAPKEADRWARESYTGVLFSGLGFEIDEAEETVKSGRADGIIFGQKAIANPDLVARAIAGAELNPIKMETMYGRGEEGYNDYPTLRAQRLSVIRAAEDEAEAQDEAEAEAGEVTEAAADEEAPREAETSQYPHLSKEEVDQINAAFDSIDEDQSGKLDKTEIAAFLKAMESDSTEDEIESMIRVYGGGGEEITREGFLNMFEDQSDGFKAEAAEHYPNLGDINTFVAVFRRFDKDFSGKIDAEELTEMVQSISGEELTKEEAEAAVGEGLTLEGFLTYLNGRSQKKEDEL